MLQSKHTLTTCQAVVHDTEGLHSQDTCKQLNCHVYMGHCLLCERLQGGCPMRQEIALCVIGKTCTRCVLTTAVLL